MKLQSLLHHSIERDLHPFVKSFRYLQNPKFLSLMIPKQTIHQTKIHFLNHYDCPHLNDTHSYLIQHQNYLPGCFAATPKVLAQYVFFGVRLIWHAVRHSGTDWPSSIS